MPRFVRLVVLLAALSTAFAAQFVMSPVTATGSVGTSASIAGGDYIISTNTTPCGLDVGDVNGQDLVIAGTRATVRTDSGESFVGSVTSRGSTFRAATKLKGSTFSIVFSGSFTKRGVIRGTYAYSGVPGGIGGGGQGVSCTYVFTGNLLAPALAPCTSAAIKASVKANTSNFYALDGFGCSGAYAYAFATVTDAQGKPIAEITILLKAKNRRWEPTSRQACTQGWVPAQIYRDACQTN
jgi:hypothetical protein